MTDLIVAACGVSGLALTLSAITLWLLRDAAHERYAIAHAALIARISR
jgi:hypothetical protein